jgi:hypothetical protein
VRFAVNGWKSQSGNEAAIIRSYEVSHAHAPSHHDDRADCGALLEGDERIRNVVE